MGLRGVGDGTVGGMGKEGRGVQGLIVVVGRTGVCDPRRGVSGWRD